MVNIFFRSVGVVGNAMSQSLPSLAVPLNSETSEKNGSCRQSLPLLPSMEEDLLSLEKKGELSGQQLLELS